MTIFERMLDNRSGDIVQTTVNQAVIVKNCKTTDPTDAVRLFGRSIVRSMALLHSIFEFREGV